MRRPSWDQRNRAVSAADGDQGDEDRGQLVAVDGVVAPAVDRGAADLVGRRPDALHAEGGPAPEPELGDLGDGHEQAEGGDQLGDGAGGAEVAEEGPVQDVAEEGGDHDDGQQEGGPDRPLVADPGVVVDRGGDEGLGPERQVEDPGRAVGQDEPDGQQGEDAPDRRAADDGVEDVGHGLRAGGPPWPRLSRRPRVPRAPRRRRSSKQMNGLPGSPNAGTNSPSSMCDMAEQACARVAGRARRSSRCPGMRPSAVVVGELVEPVDHALLAELGAGRPQAGHEHVGGDPAAEAELADACRRSPRSTPRRGSRPSGFSSSGPRRARSW